MEGGLKRFFEGSWQEAQSLLGAHRTAEGWCFRVYAPNARSVWVAGDFSDWQGLAMNRWPEGIWETTVPQAQVGQSYKYVVEGADGRTRWKADPYGVYSQLRPANASRLWEMAPYPWRDAAWREKRRREPLWEGPLNIYEVHPGSWQRQEDGSFLTYRQLADRLAPYVRDMGYHAVELLPVTEYPLDDSWGYQCVGYFAPTARYGTPEDLKYFVDRMHRAGIAVILDWVPAHFCKDEHGLIDFDGTCLYEYGDPLKREHAGWGTRVFDFGRGEVRSFLLSSAAWWLREYHMDGLRLNNVSSMLYLDYGKESWEWTPNIQGGRENLEAIDFLKRLNETVQAEVPGALMIGEEFAGFENMTLPVLHGGLGFTHMWNVRWTEAMMNYFSLAPEYRAYNLDRLVFSATTAFEEDYILPLSYKEFVYGKRSLLEKFPGLEAEKMAGVRSFFGFMMAFPGKKMSFMGSEFGQVSQWDYHSQLEWDLLENEGHRRMQTCIRELNHIYARNCPLWQDEANKGSFYWIDPGRTDPDVVAFSRIDEEGDELLVVCNFSDTACNYKLGLPEEKTYTVIFDSNLTRYGGTQTEENRRILPVPREYGSFDQYAELELAPYSVLYLRYDVQPD